MAEKRSFVIRALLPLLVILAAGVVAVLLVQTRPEPEQRPAPAKGVPVRLAEVNRRPHQLTVLAQGTVEADRTVVVQPQVGGRIVWFNAKLIPGGLVAENEPLLRLEKRDYELAVRRSRTALARAESDLALEEGRRQVASFEWQEFGEGEGGADNAEAALALRRPQLKAARASVRSARVELDGAELDLDRTEIRAPFAAVVLTEEAALGRLLTTQTQVATLAAVDRFRIEVSVPSRFLPDIALPGVNADKGSRAVIRHDLGDTRVEKEGRVVRLLPRLETAGRMARLLVEVDDPLELAETNNAGRQDLPLLIGAYVDVEIEVPGSRELIEIPREAVRNGDQVYVFTPEERLAVRKIRIVWRRPGSVLVDGGLEDGELVVTNRLASPVEGMRLRRPAGSMKTDGGGDR